MLFCLVERFLATSKPVQIVLNHLHRPESPSCKSDFQTLNLCSVSLSFSLFFYSFVFNNSSSLCVVHRRGHWWQPFSLHDSIVLQSNCPFLIIFNPYTTPPHLSVQFWPICVSWMRGFCSVCCPSCSDISLSTSFVLNLAYRRQVFRVFSNEFISQGLYSKCDVRSM